MNYIITQNSIIITIDNKPYIINSGNKQYDTLKQAIIDNKPDYIINYIIKDFCSVENAINVLLDDKA